MAQPYVGEIRMYAGNFAPAGWMFCNGQLLPIREHETLFNLIGTVYGGDGEQTFALPDLRSRAPLHMGTGPDGTTYTIGESLGTERVTLTVQQIPNHTHLLTGSTAPAAEQKPAGAVLAQSSVADMYIQDAPDGSLATNAVGPVGRSKSHDNMQPYLGISFIISMFGIFPSPT